jgi:ribosomal protein L11 methyltransferase
MYSWQRPATPRWLTRNEEQLQARLGGKLAIIERPARKRLQLEAASGSRAELRDLTKEFGGRVRKLPADWLKRFSRRQTFKPLKIGRRLIIVRSPGKREIGSFPCGLMIPAGAAFGTGEHATTAMSLQLLGWVFAGSACSPDLVVDLGTGSGILALAAKRLGANRVVGIDLDPMAISTARKNARLNKIRNVRFERADVRSWRFPPKVDVVTANLFSELLIEVLPRLRRSRWLILSGFLRTQERELARALKRNGMEVVETRRRGKWTALLSRVRQQGRQRNFEAAATIVRGTKT